ncbi:MAG: Reversal of tor2 lethality [Cirrosporium novae-zelandiae]|nr:MAG: Reversal of tor2 lethality [Cirrosporium novae-zelandiae]
MLFSISSLLLVSTLLAKVAHAQVDSQLTGTWVTKSKKVVTGSSFYDPVNDKFLEPDLTGISYSFTDDGYYEEAYYRAISNPAAPSCPQGIMQYQHGTYRKADNGSLYLTPIGVDGRQLLSKPCTYDVGIYTRYNQSEYFKKYQIYTDSYHNVLRLDLYQYDGSLMSPMYLLYKPPTMLPTSTLNPTTSSATATATGSSKQKRSYVQEPMNKNVLLPERRQASINADRVWWIGVSLTAVGSVAYLCTM